jgi:DNA ligase-1
MVASDEYLDTLIGKPLFKMDSLGGIRTWKVEVDFLNCYLVIEHGKVGGSIQEKYEEVEEGKASRDIYEQVESRARSRIRNKLDMGYVESIELAKLPKRNVMGLLMPMLAHKSENNLHKINWGNAWAQRKYNGHRCLITNQNGKIIAYSRKGREIESIGHIIDELSGIPENITLDGELYCHGVALQKIGSWIKRKQEDSKKLKYHVYDMVSSDAFEERLFLLREIIDEFEHVEIVPTRPVNHMEDVMEFMKIFRGEGYEGLMLRHGNYGYEDGKRSYSLLKFKEWHDIEAVVVDITESKDGWAILRCKMENGKEFSVSAPGTMQERTELLQNKDEFIGFSVNVKFAELTKDGIPFHPVATAWREEGE